LPAVSGLFAGEEAFFSVLLQEKPGFCKKALYFMRKTSTIIFACCITASAADSDAAKGETLC
jgi:2-methylcitrate dehydratase PrpD